jgi:hypothetical protein
LLWGTFAILALETLSLVVFAEITGQRTAEQWSPAGPVLAWWMTVGNYMVRSVVPYTAPFIAALILFDDLRKQVLGEMFTAPRRS